MPSRLRVPAALAVLALAGWVATSLAMGQMMSMDASVSVASFLWLWVAMTAAMMLPSVVPAASLAAAVGRSSLAFVSGYFVLWAAAGLAAFAAVRGLAGSGEWVAWAALVTAACYQLSPLKGACLRRCRSPLGSLLNRRAFAAGLEHAGFCLGCCWALMLVVLALGMSSLFWMAAIAAVIFVEKATAIGARASAPVALALVGATVWSVL
jgi:predicted metal-binding membrane protein